MIASDPIRALHHLLRAGGRPHMDCPVKPGNDTGKVNLIEKCSSNQSSGSSFTIAAPWLLPNHTVTGVVPLSM
jgi:hypothetical protein